jgi:outer membrane protein TolC
LQQQLIPKAQKSLEIARSGYLSGQIDFFNLMDSERTLLEFRLSEVQARTERELVVAELSLLVAGVPPASAPLLALPNEASAATPKPANSK